MDGSRPQCTQLTLNLTIDIYINTFYPHVNGLEEITAKFLNTVFNCKALGNEVSITIQCSSKLLILTNIGSQIILLFCCIR